jgi:hypothetical protein
MKMKSRQPNQYHQPVHNRSYILHLWSADQTRAASWRASLEDPHTGERFGFASLEQLFAFLMDLSEMDCDHNSRNQ